MRVYFTTANNGDGSASVCFYDSQACITKLEEKEPEAYGAGEGGGWFEVPDGTVITGIEVQNMAMVDEQLAQHA